MKQKETLKKKKRILGDGDTLALGKGLYLPVLTIKEIKKLWKLLE